MCFILFLVCLYVSVCVCEYLLHNNMRMFTWNQYSYVQGPLRECRSIRPGGFGLPYYCTPPVCVPAVLGALAVWRLSQKKRKNCNALEIIFDLPFGFPINNIISLQRLTINKHSQIKKNQKNNNYTSGGRRSRLVVPLPIEKRSFWCPARQCPRQNRTRSNISGGSDRPWSSNPVNGDRPGGKPKTPSGPQLHAMGLSTLSWPACTLTGMCTTMSCRCSQTLYSKTTPAGEWPPGLEASVRDECFHWCTLWWPPHLQCRCTEIHDPSVPPTGCA